MGPEDLVKRKPKNNPAKYCTPIIIPKIRAKERVTTITIGSIFFFIELIAKIVNKMLTVLPLLIYRLKND